MIDFWNNIIRYPQFFVSSFIGLILIILTPLKNLFKVPKLRMFIFFGLVVCFLFLYITIISMIGL